MLQPSIITIVASAIFLLLTTECSALERQGEILSCWPYPVTLENFTVDYYFSSRSKKDVQLSGHQSLGVDIDFDPSRRTAVIAHGYLGKGHNANINALRDALLLWRDMNVIVVDWQRGCSNIFIYPQAAANTVKVAASIKALMVRLTEIIEKPFAEWNTVHFIGYSLGAHVVGQAGALLKKENNLSIHRITGLDPAEPCFDNVNSPLRLKKSNARYVDVIHTDAALKKNERFGLRDELGHADFYINGGYQQPGCSAPSYNDVLKMKGIQMMIEKISAAPPTTIEQIAKYIGDLLQHVTLGNGLCHHDRSLHIFTQSIIQAREKSCQFLAHPWSLRATKLETLCIINEKCSKNNCIQMGINAEYNQRPGAYYVKTTAMSPYCVTS